MPCTTILIGKNAAYDGSTMMARNEDAGAGAYAPKRFIVVRPEEQPRHYRSVISKVEMVLPDSPLRYTAMPNAIPSKGIWGEAGINAENVAMSETETITSNPRVLGADPLVPGGIGEEDMLTIVLPYIRSAREGVLRLGYLLETYGTYETNGIGFQDKDEIWWLESVGGHHWIAKRVPDDQYVVMPNQQGIDRFDFADAFGARENHLCSSDMLSFIQENHLDLSFSEKDLAENAFFDARAAFGSRNDSDHSYNTPRAWFMERFLNPNTFRWDGGNADYSPESDTLPWSLKPEKKITVEDVKYVLSSYYQGTPYNPYGRHGDASMRGQYRSIGVNRTNFMALTQLRPNLPKEIMAVEWLSVGCNAFNAIVPFYANINATPAYLSNTDSRATTENFYWANRIIAALADAHYSSCIAHVDRYQNSVVTQGHALIRECDGAFLSNTPSNAAEYLENCNQRMADLVKKETDALLGQVLYAASNEMKNSFSRSDA